MLPSGEQLPAAEILDAEWSEAAPTPLSEELLRAIVEQMPMRSQEAIRSDRPPSLSGYQWQRVAGQGWNLWQVFEGPEGKQHQLIGMLDFDRWQEIKNAHYTPRNPIQPDLAGDPGDRGPDAPGPAGGGEQPRRGNRERQARPAPASKNVVPINSRRPNTAKASKKQKHRPAGDGETPPTLAGYKRVPADYGWIYWRQVLTPTEKRDARGRIQYRRTKSYGVRIGKRTWNILRRYDNGTIITIISGRIAARTEHRDSAGQRSAAAG